MNDYQKQLMRSVDLNNLKPKENSITEFLDNNKCHTRVNKDTSFKSSKSCFDFKFTSKKYSFIIANLFETSNSKMQVGEFQVCRLQVCEFLDKQFANCELWVYQSATCDLQFDQSMSCQLWISQYENCFSSASNSK